MEQNELALPPEPLKPRDEDCCCNGCQVCVFDLYELDLKRWRMKVDLIKSPQQQDKCFDDALFTDLEYIPLVIVSITTLMNALKCYEFEIPVDKKVNLSEGQHLMTRAFARDNATIVRPFTPVVFDDEGGKRFIVYIQLYENGEMSKYIRSHWTIGASVDWRGPFGNYNYIPNNVGSLYLICGGTGIAPMLSIIQKVLSNENDETLMFLLYSTRQAETIIAKHKLDEWKQYWNFYVVYFLTGGDVNMERMSYGDDVINSRIKEVDLQKIISRSHQSSKKFLVCGSTEFNSDIRNLVLKLNVCQKDEIYCF